jgi:hypothetical protein
MYKKNANLYRLHMPIFWIRNKVWLKTSNISMTQLLHILIWKHMEPYHVRQRVDIYDYELDLLDCIKIYSIFYILLLDAALDNPILG